MLTHIYPHKPQRKIEVTICKITRLTAHFMCGLMSDLLICKFIETYGHTWHRMSLLRPGVIKPYETKPNHLVSPYISARTTEEDLKNADLCNRQADNPTSCVAWCLIRWYASLMRMMCFTSNALTEPRCHKTITSWPPDHDSTFYVTETPALTSRPSVTSLNCPSGW